MRNPIHPPAVALSAGRGSAGKERGIMRLHEPSSRRRLSRSRQGRPDGQDNDVVQWYEWQTGRVWDGSGWVEIETVDQALELLATMDDMSVATGPVDDIMAGDAFLITPRKTGAVAGGAQTTAEGTGTTAGAGEGAAMTEAASIKDSADFICEAVDQTRGWFYSLHAISTMLGLGPAFRNVIVNDPILDAEGRKMNFSAPLPPDLEAARAWAAGRSDIISIS